jgi:hypothetical protein
MSLREAVRTAAGAAVDAPGGGDEQLLAFPIAMVIGLWWWVRGVPVKSIPSSASTDSDDTA